jgi:hypothetical protein
MDLLFQHRKKDDGPSTPASAAAAAPAVAQPLADVAQTALDRIVATGEYAGQVISGAAADAYEALRLEALRFAQNPLQHTRRWLARIGIAEQPLPIDIVGVRTVHDGCAKPPSPQDTLSKDRVDDKGMLHAPFKEYVRRDGKLTIDGKDIELRYYYPDVMVDRMEQDEWFSRRVIGTVAANEQSVAEGLRRGLVPFYDVLVSVLVYRVRAPANNSSNNNNSEK